MNIIPGETNFFDKDTLIFEAGDNVEYIAYIHKGSVIKDGNSSKIEFSEKRFLCYDDICEGYYTGDYYAREGSEILILPCSSSLELIMFLYNHKQFHKNYTYPICCLCNEIAVKYSKLFKIISTFYNAMSGAYNSYLKLCKKAGVTPESYKLMHDVQKFDLSNQVFGQNLSVFRAFAVDAEKEKQYYSATSGKYLNLQLDVINRSYIGYEDMLFYLKNMINNFASADDKCLFSLVTNLASNIDESLSEELLKLLNDMKTVVTSIDATVKNTINYTLDIDYNRVNFYFLMAESANTTQEVEEEIPVEDETSNETEDISDNINIKNILLQLCNYADCTKEEFVELDNYMTQYMSLSDKYSKENEIRIYRKKLSEAYFNLYEKVFLKYAADNKTNKLVKTFLDFGLVDERLLTNEHIEEILNIKPFETEGPCKVYRISDWLLRVYNGKDIPSKNEFDLEYVDYVRELKKNQAMSPNEERALLNDNVAKVRYEIENMLKYNCRLLNGNLTTFYPMLSEDNFEKSISSLILTPEVITDTVEKLKSIDYSIFYREIMYANPECKIDKEVIQKEIYPTFILFPVEGVNGVMWQDVSGKRSNSSGRFFLPAFFDGNIEDTMLSLLGKYRWELCKTLQGMAWNNIQVPSLTSEFNDYIQFYRKNKELSPEKKELVKNQLSRCHNSIREYFIVDYITWIKYESTGAMRLNKTSRRILATYCTPTKECREKLMTQPAFEEAFKRFNIARVKKAKEYQSRITYYQARTPHIPDEIMKTRAFYEL